MAYDENVVPFDDKSMQWFIEAMCKSSSASPNAIRRIVHQCWRDLRNACAKDAEIPAASLSVGDSQPRGD